MMMRQPTIFTVLLFVLLATGCAIEPPAPPSHFTLAHDDFYARVKTIAIAPLATPSELQNPAPVAAKFEALIAETLRDSGYTVVPSKEYAVSFAQARDRQGGYFDPNSGKLDEAKHDAVLKATRKELGDKFQVDAVLYPEIQIVDARWHDQWASWDGVTETIQSATGLVAKGVVKFATEPAAYLIGNGPHEDGTVQAYTLVASIDDMQGDRMYANRGGIQVLDKLTGHAFIPVPGEELFSDAARNAKAVNLALEDVARAGCETDFQVTPCNGPRLASGPEPVKRLVFVLQGGKASASADWERFRTEWDNAIVASAAARGIEASVSDTPAVSGPETSVLAVATINDFNFISKSRYYWVGVMSGRPYIDADVDYYKLPDKTSHIRRQYKATSLSHATCTEDGACALPPMTEEQIKIICDAIVAELVRH